MILTMLHTGVAYEVIKGKARETETERETKRERDRETERDRDRERERKSVCLMKEGGRSEMTSRGAHGGNRGTHR